MTETPAAAPAAPAAPVAPAAAPAAPVAPVAAPAAPAAPEAAPAAPAAPAAAPAVESLIPAEPSAPAAAVPTEAEKIEAARRLVKEADAAADPNSGKAWLLHEGVMGTGEKPGWFKQEKYKTVAAQAEAYVGLEKRFGAFTGAPKNDKGEVAYKFTPPEGVTFQMDHPVAQAFTKWAGENQLSQEGFNTLLGDLVQYEMAQQPRMENVKTALGDKVDERVANADAWVKANLGAEGRALFRDAVSTQGPTQEQRIAATFKLIEQLVGKTAQIRMPKAGQDVPGGQGGDALAKIKSDMGAKMPDGKTLRIHADPEYQREIDKRFREYHAAQGA